MTEIIKQLSEKFSPERIVWRVVPQSRDNVAKAVPTLDVRDVRARLDQVMGRAGWSLSYAEVQSEGKLLAVRCDLALLIDNNLISKSDVVSVARESEQVTDATLKTAYADALKRAALQWGIGAYLFGFKPVQVTVDAAGKITETPQLPAELTPGQEATAAPSSAAKQVAQALVPAAAAKPAASPAKPATPVAPEPTPEAGPAKASEASTADTSDIAALEEQMSKNPMVKSLLEKLKKIPPQMVRSYVEGPKGKQSLNAAEQAYLLKRVADVEKAAPAPATA